MIFKQHSPLVLNITNLVVMNTTANMLLALGASPLMAHATEELDEMASIADSLVLNIGTLDQHWLSAMQQAQNKAIELRKPVIFDPVGAGASHMRTQAAQHILQTGVTVVRGNASEILALTDNSFHARGVDSQHSSEHAIQAAQHLTQQYNCCVVISGEADYVCSKGAMQRVTGGDEMLTRITGMGCSATALIAAFAALESDPMHACINAMTVMKMASEQATTTANGPGSFYTALLDAIYSITEDELNTRNEKRDRLAAST
ncbi:MAG: hydroxyethylthiazole kinase [Coxiellaceae bacterium]|nr:hydroxyethylthiazole kinase [Coxiellaceae bacterium]